MNLTKGLVKEKMKAMKIIIISLDQAKEMKN